MMSIKQMKEELVLDCEKFASLLRDRSTLEAGSLGGMLSMNRDIFQKLQQVLIEGDEVDRKEAMTAFSQVFGALSEIAKQAKGNLGFSSEISDQIKEGQTFDLEPLKMMQKLGKDLAELAKKSI